MRLNGVDWFLYNRDLRRARIKYIKDCSVQDFFMSKSMSHVSELANCERCQRNYENEGF